MLKSIIHSLTINGVKNISKPITLTFTNKSLSTDNDFSDSNIKAIYGTNGSGKSGIITALYIYKDLITKYNSGLNNEKLSSLTSQIINRKLKEMSIDIIFSFYQKDNIVTYKHFLKIGLTPHSDLIIKKEVISILNGYRINNEKFDTLIEINNGKIIEINNSLNDLKTKELIVDISTNLLDKNSIASIYFKNFKNTKTSKSIKGNKLELALLFISTFAFNLIVELEREDKHSEFLSFSNTDFLTNKGSNLPSFNELSFDVIGSNIDIIDDSNLKKYKEKIKNLEKFIEIFKPELKEINLKIKKQETKNYCEKVFNYGEYEVNVEYESTGIKKLVRLFNAISDSINGSIVFIDEMDSGIHDVYFTKMIEFFSLSGKGQLVFTTHNLEPIEILKYKKHSLDFLSPDSKIYSRKREGNVSPKNKYVSGLMPYSNFNIEALDFIILLNDEEESKN